MRIAFGIILLVHGIAHLVGFVVPWRLMSSAEMPYKTALFAGHWEVGDVGMRVNGLLWLVAALAFLFAGIAVMRQAHGGETLALYVSLASLALCVVSWPEARIGLFINLAILVYLLIGYHLGWSFRVQG